MDDYDGAERREDNRIQARVIARETVREMLVSLGADMENPLEMQEDFAWLRRYRKLSEKLGSRILLTLITLLTAGIAAVVWETMRGNS